MTGRPDKLKKIKHLTLVGVRDVSDDTAKAKYPESKSSKGKSKATKVPTKAASSVPTAPPDHEHQAAPGGENADRIETLPDGYFEDDFPDHHDDYFDTLDDLDPKAGREGSP